MIAIVTMLRRFVADDHAGGAFNDLLATSLAGLLALGTVYEARLAVADTFDALAAALIKQGRPY